MSTEDTSGFYKVIESTILAYAANMVSSPDANLYRVEKDSYTYPVDGWRWFDSRADALSFYGLQENSSE